MSKTIKIKTSARNYTWAIQRKVSGKWETVVDEHGPIFIATRKIARDVSRQFQNVNSKRPRSFRVKKFAAV